MFSLCTKNVVEFEYVLNIEFHSVGEIHVAKIF